LAEGQSEQEILDYFAEMYGDSVLAQPPPRQWAAWALPALILALGAAALIFWLRSWTRPIPVATQAVAAQAVAAQAVAEEQVEEDQPHIERLERELAEWE
jgi:cytochrome c-type biogenesis protein CcmH/NrfF